MGKTETIDIERRLWHWAAWTILFNKNQQGWPKESPIAKFRREGFLVNENQSRSSSLLYCNDEAEEINALFNILKEQNRFKAEIIYFFYVLPIPVRKYAEVAKIHPSTFYKNLRAAKQWFADWVK